MQYFPVNIRCSDANIVVVGGDPDAVAKIRLLLKTDAHISVFADQIDPAIHAWHEAGKLKHVPRMITLGDLVSVRLAYISGADATIRDQAIDMLDQSNIPFCVIDDLARSRFITPAIVDRDPVMIAIGTEGKAPVLARRIKAMIEQNLSPHTGMLAEISGRFRQYIASYSGAFRRQFWGRLYDDLAPSIINAGGNHIHKELDTAMHDLLDQMDSEKAILATASSESEPLPIAFVSAGPGDPDLLTMKARRYLDQAEVILHDRLVSPAILELARREATLIDVGKTGYGHATPQDTINDMLISHGKSGVHVVRLKSGDSTIFGRLDEELAACRSAGLDYIVVPGITAASAAAAGMKVSLTRRGRNSEWRLLTARDMKGFADHQWQDVATSGAVSAIYMGLKAIPYLQGRLLMHGGDPSLPITLASKVSQPQQHFIPTTLGCLVEDATAAELDAPVVIMLGLHPDAVRMLSGHDGDDLQWRKNTDLERVTA